MGKTLKFPKRQKYIAPTPKGEDSEAKPLSEEEHKKRLELLKSLGLVK